MNQAKYTKITPQEAKKIMDSEEVIILDVRTLAEYNQGHIENSVLLPYDEIAQKAAQVIPDKQSKVLVYCRSGNRSGIASRDLVSMGYTNILDFGGIMDWPYEVVK